MILIFSCSRSPVVQENRKDYFNPIHNIDYSFHQLDDNKINLKIFFSINKDSFVYDKNEENEYLANIEIIFQILDNEGNKEIDRKLLELEILKDDFFRTKNNNNYEGSIDFSINKESHLLNIKLIDVKSKRSWNKKIDVEIDSATSLSNLYLYYNDKTGDKRLYDSLDSSINEVNCRFQYFNQIKDVENLKIFLLNKNDTLFYEKISIKENENEYDIPVYLDSTINGDIRFCITDGNEFREKKLTIKNRFNKKDFWSNDLQIIKGVMRYILPYKQYKKIKNMNDLDMISFLKKYWHSLDPNEETEVNEFLIELNNRIKRVNSRFKEMKTEGWNTDRGRIYIINGEPNSIRTEHNPNTNNIREIWSYQSGNIYMFEENSFGRFYLINESF